jgi:cytidine deaminase
VKSKKTVSTKTLETLLGLAIEAQKNSYSPYSKYQVGAALITEEGDIFTGTNIENASYGGTVCAERVAIWKTLSEKPRSLIKEILVLSPKGQRTWPPCGLCLQVLAEFSKPTTRVYLASQRTKPDSTRKKSKKALHISPNSKCSRDNLMQFEVETLELRDLLPKIYRLS